MPFELAIETRGLCKRFGATKVVRGIDLQVRRGTVYGLLGPSGAGKTTTLRMLATELAPSAGEARVLGHDLVREADRIRDRIRPLNPFSPAEEKLSGRDSLMVLARMQGLSWLGSRVRADTLLKAFELQTDHRPIKHYPTHLRRRLNTAALLLAGPELIFLDEPTAGLSLQARDAVWDLIHDVAADGASVLLSTPCLTEAGQLAERVAFMEQGTIVAEGTRGELRQTLRRHAPLPTAPYWLTDTAPSATLPRSPS